MSLCTDCVELIFTMAADDCECGEEKNSAFEYCEECAMKKDCCEACGKSIKHTHNSPTPPNLEEPLPLGEAFRAALEAIDFYMNSIGKKANEGWCYTTPFSVSFKDGHLLVFVRGKVISSETDGRLGIKVAVKDEPLITRAKLDS